AGSTGHEGLVVAPSGGLDRMFTVLTTNQKGFVAEQAVIFECAKRGIPVARPLDDQRYDLVIDVDGQLLRVQCKWAVREGEVVSVRTRRCRRGREGIIHRRYEADEIDCIAAYCVDTRAGYRLPHELW